MGSFVQAGKRTKNIIQFLKDAASSENSIRYRAEKGKKHYIHIIGNEVVTKDENGNEVVSVEAIALSAAVHEWEDGDGYKSTVSLHDVIRKADDGTLINTGECPICNNISKAWNIYKYRMDEAEKNCKLTGEEREKSLEGFKKQFLNERKAKEVKNYIYILVALFRTDNKGEPILDKTTDLPEFDLKVMRLSASRAEKIQKQLENSGMELIGSELVFEYPNSDDPRLVVSQSTTAPVFPNRMFTHRYPELNNAIKEAASKFDWDGIEKSFPEWNGMTNAQAEALMSKYFKPWDDYLLEAETNPNAKYLDTTDSKEKTNPALETTKEEVKQPQIDVNTIFGGAGLNNADSTTGSTFGGLNI